MPGLTGRDDIFFAAVAMTRMPMIVTDPAQADNPIVFANRAFSDMTGYEERELLGRNCRFLQGEATDPASLQLIRDAIAARHDVAVELLNYRKDGTAFWNGLFISPVFDLEGNLLYFFGSQLDVTRRRSAENALRQSQKIEALGQLTGGVAHDFNNLLTVVLGNLDAAERADGDRTKLARHHAQIRTATERGAKLTGQLLTFARSHPLSVMAISVGEVIAALEPLIRHALFSTMTLRLDLAPTLPRIGADIEQLQVALLHVVTNAREAMAEDGTLTISARAVEDPGDEEMPPGPAVEITVADDGNGMTPAVLERATEPFFTTKARGRGVGLGLSHAYGFARQSGGRLVIESAPGHGTRVRFLFPALPADGEVPQRNTPHAG